MTKGVAFAFLAFAVFAWGDAIVKEIGHEISPFEVTFFGSLMSLVLSPMLMGPGDRIIDLVRWTRPWLMTIRLLCVACTSLLIVVAFTNLPFAEAFALLFLMPSLVLILAVLVLKETVTWRTKFSIGAAFIGVLVIVRPGFEEVHFGHLAAIGGALCSAGVVITGRLIGHTEKQFTLTGSVFLATAALSGLLMVPSFTWPTPDQWILLTAFSATSFVGGRLFIFAIMYAPADEIGAAQYSQIVWALAIGAIFFDEWPDTISMCGILIIVGAGLLMFSTKRTFKPTQT